MFSPSDLMEKLCNLLGDFMEKTSGKCNYPNGQYGDCKEIAWRQCGELYFLH